MNSQDHDTDPSTPGAKRFSEPRQAAAAPAALLGEAPPPSGMRPSRVNTDPGLAPPPSPLSPSQRPMGVIVPPASVRRSDSVDLLLEGINREQPDRLRPAPQSDGQSAAAYHGQHAIHAAMVTYDEGPKVVIDRPVLGETLRLDRPWTDATAISPPPLFGRVFVAVVAGFVVVGLIFVSLQRTAEKTVAVAQAPAPLRPAPAAPEPPPAERIVLQPIMETAPPPEPPGREANEAEGVVEAMGTSGGSVSSHPAPPGSAKPVRAKPKSPAPATTSRTKPELGEFKQSF